MQNYALRMAGSILEKLRVFFVKIWTKTEIVLNFQGLASKKIGAKT